MTAVATAGRRFLPRGWVDFARQLAIWFGFVLVYQVARGIADRNPAKAFENGLKVVEWEQRAQAAAFGATHDLFEVTLQRVSEASGVISDLAAFTYWNSEFTVLGLTLLWVYLRRNDAFTRLRNAILLANVLGLVGYVLLPTAPPRMFPELGFVDTLARFGGLNHGSGLVELASNPYAAMPSLHAADALIVGVVLAAIARRLVVKLIWVAWPGWVSFSVMATANHFWLDIVAGMLLALVALAVVYRVETKRIIAKLL